MENNVADLNFFTVSETAKLLKVTRRTIQRQTALGAIQASKFGRRVLYSKAAIEAALSHLQAA